MILDDLFEGRIRPEENDISRDRLCAEARSIIEKRKRYLLAKVSDEERAQLESLFDEENRVSAIELKASYIQGMRLGAKLVSELLKKK